MNSLVLTYALIKSLYEQGEDYIDSFWPFAVRIFPNDKAISVSDVQISLIERFGLTVPLHVLGTILDRAKNKELIERQNNSQKYIITEAGLKHVDSLETDSSVERRINALIEDLAEFCQTQQPSFDHDKVHDLLLSFVRKNIEPLLELLNSSLPGEVAIPRFTGDEALLIDYIRVAERQKPAHYEALQDMVFGSIISSILYVNDVSELTEIKNRKFGSCFVFLDTNFVFSFLELMPPEFSKPAQELFKLLKHQGFDLKVFSFTVNEICGVIRKFMNQSHIYPTSIHINSIYSCLKRKHWSKTDAIEFIVNIEDKLEKHGITIVNADVDLYSFNPQNAELRSLITKHKPAQSLIPQNHDLAAIEQIRKIRGQQVYKIEDAKAIFLTSDIKLNRFNFEEMGHKDDGTVCEVILDRLLVSILWLKDPTTKVPLHSIIAAHSRELFIKKRVWEQFYKSLKVLKQEGRVGDNISALFYHNYIENTLRPLDDIDADSVTPEFVLERVEDAAKIVEEVELLREKEFAKNLQKKVAEVQKAKDEEWLDNLDKRVAIIEKTKDMEWSDTISKRVSEAQEDKDKEWAERVKIIKENASNIAQNTARYSVLSIRFLACASIALPLLSLSKGGIETLNYLTAILSIIIFVGGLSFAKLWKAVEKTIYGAVNNKARKILGLHELEM